MDEYTYTITIENEAVVYFNGQELYRSRAFRLPSQADRAAREFIEKARGDAPKTGGVTLVVQNVSVNPNTFFRRKSNG